MRFFRKSEAGTPERAARVYGEIMKASRREAFYRDLGVADSLDGRFEMLCVHAYLAMRRLKQVARQDAAALSQALFDAMFQDLDAALRQIGVSDIRIGKEVKKMAKAYLGRVQAYDAALDARDLAMLDDAILRNVYRGRSENPVAAVRLRQYMVCAEAALAAQADDDVACGGFGFPAIEDMEVRSA